MYAVVQYTKINLTGNIKTFQIDDVQNIENEWYEKKSSRSLKKFKHCSALLEAVSAVLKYLKTNFNGNIT